MRFRFARRKSSQHESLEDDESLRVEKKGATFLPHFGSKNVKGMIDHTSGPYDEGDTELSSYHHQQASDTSTITEDFDDQKALLTKKQQKQRQKGKTEDYMADEHLRMQQRLQEQEQLEAKASDPVWKKRLRKVNLDRKTSGGELSKAAASVAATNDVTVPVSHVSLQRQSSYDNLYSKEPFAKGHRGRPVSRSLISGKRSSGRRRNDDAVASGSTSENSSTVSELLDGTVNEDMFTVQTPTCPPPKGRARAGSKNESDSFLDDSETMVTLSTASWSSDSREYRQGRRYRGRRRRDEFSCLGPEGVMAMEELNEITQILFRDALSCVCGDSPRGRSRRRSSRKKSSRRVKA